MVFTVYVRSIFQGKNIWVVPIGTGTHPYRTYTISLVEKSMDPIRNQTHQFLTVVLVLLIHIRTDLALLNS